jgi:hypothetical protein
MRRKPLNRHDVRRSIDRLDSARKFLALAMKD